MRRSPTTFALHALGARLGRTVGELRRVLPSHALTQWLAFATLERILPEEKADREKKARETADQKSAVMRAAANSAARKAKGGAFGDRRR
jgi:hypothetical protein